MTKERLDEVMEIYFNIKEEDFKNLLDLAWDANWEVLENNLKSYGLTLDEWLTAVED